MAFQMTKIDDFDFDTKSYKLAQRSHFVFAIQQKKTVLFLPI